MGERPVSNVPHVDQSMTTAEVAALAERIAVPNFDWITQPIDAVVDGLTGHGTDATAGPSGHADER